MFNTAVVENTEQANYTQYFEKTSYESHFTA